ncbi:hypothetical protein ACFOED_10045 [Vulcaniibacterium thermophilum]|jgi:outer membrane translocation and assembly module TamA|uniref:Uncharacterized protein n=1 Tax=Vulcaniibacterium thermophilum TaxID=1169913 RepID=A0A918ZAG6_9GAMM|nr:hypothetical protein [Vulcaniibacterium thermophilum]GHE43624.1 hypothetical protein GCM10007167_26740 [Vulcaniibacterium thermophilum]
MNTRTVAPVIAPSPSTNRPDAAAVPFQATSHREREREFGFGYGNSSGYGTRRRYTTPWAQPRFRFA